MDENFLKKSILHTSHIYFSPFFLFLQPANLRTTTQAQTASARSPPVTTALRMPTLTELPEQ